MTLASTPHRHSAPNPQHGQRECLATARYTLVSSTVIGRPRHGEDDKDKLLLSAWYTCSPAAVSARCRLAPLPCTLYNAVRHDAATAAERHRHAQQYNRGERRQHAHAVVKHPQHARRRASCGLMKQLMLSTIAMPTPQLGSAALLSHASGRHAPQHGDGRHVEG